MTKEEGHVDLGDGVYVYVDFRNGLIRLETDDGELFYLTASAMKNLIARGSMKVPKQKAKQGAKSKPREPLDSRDLADVEPMIVQIGLIAAHVREAWYEDEQADGLKRLHEARAQLELFRRLATAHYDRVLADL